MNLENQNILFLTRTMGLGGTENVVLQLCEIFKPHVNKIIVCSCGGINIEKLRDMNIIHHEIPDIEKKDIKSMASVLQKLAQIIEEENISVIHTHHRMAAFYACLLSKKFKFVFINTCHNTFHDKRILTKIIYSKCNLVACGYSVKDNLNNYFNLKKKNISVIPNAVKEYDKKIENISELTKWKSKGYYLIGNIGRLSHQKGMEYFIKAIPLIKEQEYKTKFVIVGSGEDKDKLIKLAIDLNVANEILFLGYRNDVQNVISQIDLMVLSSLWEGLPLIPIETFSVGKTIVATSVGGTAEIVKDENNGYLVPIKDYKALAEKVIMLIKNPKIKKEFEQNALKTYKLKFNFEKFKDEYLELYKSI